MRGDERREKGGDEEDVDDSIAADPCDLAGEVRVEVNGVLVTADGGLPYHVGVSESPTLSLYIADF